MSTTNTSTQGYAVTLGAAVVLSTTGIFIRHLTQAYHMPALVLALWRDVFVAATLAAALALVRPGLLRIPRRHWLYLAGYGVALALFNAFLTVSIALNGAAVGTVLVYSSTVFTVALGWVFFREEVTWEKSAAVFVALIGCVYVAGADRLDAWTGHPAGIIAGILSGVMYAVYTLLGKSSARRGLNAWGTMVYIFAFAAAALLVCNAALAAGWLGAVPYAGDVFWLGNSVGGWGVLLLLAAGPTVIGFGLYLSSLNYLPAGVVNLVVMSETVFTAVIAYVLLGERFESGQILGSGILFAAVIFLRLREERVPLAPLIRSWMRLRWKAANTAEGEASVTQPN
jgi:drug/metabolite transporter (DMT)-like permease